MAARSAQPDLAHTDGGRCWIDIGLARGSPFGFCEAHVAHFDNPDAWTGAIRDFLTSAGGRD
jgi:hypothetical protein